MHNSNPATCLSFKLSSLSVQDPKSTSDHVANQPQQAQDFLATITRAAEDLKSRGWAVIDGVLTPAECEAYISGLWRWLSSLGGGIHRDDPSSWHEAWPPTFKGIINTLEVAHQDFVWNIRKHPRILQVFSALYGRSDLLSSFDSINCVRPGQHDTKGWLHVDQAPLRRGLYCIQGLVNLVDVGPDTTGTLMVKDKSHLAHERFFKEHSCLTPEQQAATKDFYAFQPQELPFWDAFESHAVPGKAGSLFLWDSRTAHQNVLPALSSSWRHVCYVCHQPRSFATPEDLLLKQQAYINYRVTTHWPARNVALFPDLQSKYSSSSTVVASNAAASTGAVAGSAAGTGGAAVNGTLANAVGSSTAAGAGSGAANGHEVGGEDSKEASAATGAANGAANGAADGATGGRTNGAANGATEGSANMGGSSNSSSSYDDEAPSYWQRRYADGSAQRMLLAIRTRHLAEDRTLLQLAGMVEYTPHEVAMTKPSLQMQG